VVRTRMTLLIPAFALVQAPPVFSVELLCLHNAPLPTLLRVFHRFGLLLQPRYVVGARALDQ
jgi:hypothetical protein